MLLLLVLLLDGFYWYQRSHLITCIRTVPKIQSQGFNRAFAGKNAVVYGKGVYFARDSRYSANTTYSRP